MTALVTHLAHVVALTMSSGGQAPTILSPGGEAVSRLERVGPRVRTCGMEGGRRAADCEADNEESLVQVQPGGLTDAEVDEAILAAVSLDWCDLCSEIGLANAAIADVQVPGTGGMYASVCAAHEYRIRGAVEHAAEVADATCAGEGNCWSGCCAHCNVSLPRPSRVPSLDLENARATLAGRTPT